MRLYIIDQKGFDAYFEMSNATSGSIVERRTGALKGGNGEQSQAGQDAKKASDVPKVQKVVIKYQTATG